MFCTSCGNKLEGRFCKYCGVEAVNAPVSAQPQYQAPIHNAPRNTLLSVVGILLIIFSALGILSVIWILLTADNWIWYVPGTLGMWIFSYGMEIVYAAYLISIGAIAIKYCQTKKNTNMHSMMGIAPPSNDENIRKVTMLRILGIIAISFRMFINIFDMAAGFFAETSIAILVFTMLYGLILPILYTIGAHRNVQIYANERLREEHTNGLGNFDK